MGASRTRSCCPSAEDGLPAANLYSIEFDLAHVWDDRPAPKGANKIYADIFEQWLEPR